jgi:hypothetical protein
MGWLKERIERDRRLESEAPKLWDGLTNSIATAVREWGSEGGIATITPVRNGMVLRLVNEKTGEKLEIGWNPIEPCVTCREAGRSDKHLGFGWDGGELSFTMDGKPVDVEMACRLLTDPIFR